MQDESYLLIVRSFFGGFLLVMGPGAMVRSSFDLTMQVSAERHVTRIGKLSRSSATGTSSPVSHAR